jgi:hypothetical protein
MTTARTSLIRKLDKLFSRHIRQKHANEGGWVECVTCKKWLPWEDAHAGHFVRRRHFAVRWDPQNVHPQCVACNTFLDGNEGEYARFIRDTYGNETLDRLLDSKKIEKKWTINELRELLEQYE